MLNMTLRFTRPDARTIVLRLPYLFRIIIGGAAAALFVGMLTREGFALAPFIVILLMAAAASYIERWTFSAADGSIRYQIGLPVLQRTERYGFEEVEAVGLRQFTKGKVFDSDRESAGNRESGRGGILSRSYVRVSLFLTDGDELDIETQPVRGGRDVGEQAEKIANLLGKPLREE